MADGYVGHFVFWYTAQEIPFQDAHAIGQFGPVPIRTSSIELLGNPAQKNAEPVNDQYAHLHLVAYRLIQPPPFQGKVRITNQFGEEEWSIGDPALLLVPAYKRHDDSPVPTPPQGPHFVCYEVTKAPYVRPIRVRDQFIDQQIGLRPKYLAVPVDKNNEGMWNKDAHLALYEFCGHTFPEPITVYARDQFGHWQLPITRSGLLGVPSKKDVLEG
jgi:hypothetical protein